MFACAIFAELAANKAVLVLVRVEVIKRFLKIECARTVFSKHHNKRGIPHKKVAVKRGVDKIRNKMKFTVGRAQIGKRGTPSKVIAGEHVIATAPHRGGEQVCDFFVFG